jgi:hypothetical protein
MQDKACRVVQLVFGCALSSYKAPYKLHVAATALCHLFMWHCGVGVVNLLGPECPSTSESIWGILVQSLIEHMTPDKGLKHMYYCY